jgi:hypothetical protein
MQAKIADDAAIMLSAVTFSFGPIKACKLLLSFLSVNKERRRAGIKHMLIAAPIMAKAEPNVRIVAKFAATPICKDVEANLAITVEGARTIPTTLSEY